MLLTMKLYGDEASHVERLRVTEAKQEATYENAQRRLNVMTSTHHLYQEKTEQELAQLRPYAYEWSHYAKFRQLQKDENVYEKSMRERLGATCDALS